MKIGIISDLHVDSGGWYDFDPEEDVLYINAGDIANRQEYRDLFHSKYSNVFTIKGNHDYYDKGFSKSQSGKIVNYVSNGLKIAGATLWTHIESPLSWIDYCRGLNDKAHFPGLTQEIYNEMHRQELEYLLNSEADIIVSHHLPSYKSVHPMYTFADTNCGFVTELSDKIMSMKKSPILWIHGHTHTECDYMIGNTRVVCHPRGYRWESNYRNYQPKIVEI